MEHCGLVFVMSYAHCNRGVTTVVTVTSHDLSWFQWIVLHRFQCGQCCTLCTYTTDFFVQLINARVNCAFYGKVIVQAAISRFSFLQYYGLVIRCQCSTGIFQLFNVYCIVIICATLNISNFVATHVEVATSDIYSIATEGYFRTIGVIGNGSDVSEVTFHVEGYFTIRISVSSSIYAVREV